MSDSVTAAILIAGPLIRRFEACRLQSYPDAGGVWTIGWGDTVLADGTRVGPGMTITQADADALNDLMVERFAAQVHDAVTAATPPHVLAAFTSLAYNIGINPFRASSALRFYLAGDQATAAAWIGEWVRVGGVVEMGLVRRRFAESVLFLTGKVPSAITD